MKKLLSYIALLFILFNVFSSTLNTSYALFDTIDFLVKKDTDWSYSSNLNDISRNNTLLNFQIVSFNNWDLFIPKNYSISLPSWFSYSWIINNWDCNISNISAWSSFSFDVNWLDWCILDLQLDYLVTNTTSIQTHNISLVQWATQINSVSVWVTWNNSITEANTIDSNRDWFIDSYKLVFGENITWTFNSSWLTIWWYTPVLSWSVSWKIAYLSFTDWIFDTRQTPQILDTDWWMFDNVRIIWNNDIVETDWVAAEILKFNNTNYTTWNVNIDWTSNIDLLISEDLNSWLTNANFTLKDKDNLSITWVLSLNWTWLIFNPNTTLYSDKNPFTLVWITDWAWNITPSIQINIFDNVNPVWENIWLTNTWVRIDYWNIYTKNQIVNLAFSWADDTWITQMMIWNDSSFTNSSWHSYIWSSPWVLSAWVWTRTVYVKFRDAAWNTSPTYSDSIILDTSIPNVAFSHTEWTYNSSLTLSMTGSPVWTNIYYTLDWTTPNSSSGTLYTSWILIWTWVSNYNFKILWIYTDISWNINSEIYSRTYTFNCPTIANATVTCTYPTYTFTCNSWYNKSWNSCIAPSSSWGGGWSSVKTCTDTQLVCKNWKYYRKTWVSCNWWNLWKACNNVSTSTWTTNTWTTNTWSISDNLNNWTWTTTWSWIDIIDTISTIKTDNWETIIFIDIYNSFAKNYIETIAKKSITKWYSDQTFRPNTNITRIEYLKMVIKGLGIEYLSYVWKKNPFWDVNDDSWQSPIVAKALELWIITKNKYFYPDKAISRLEAMKMLVSRAKINVWLNEFEKYSFVDISWTMARYVEKAYILWLINWQTTDKWTIFRPNDNISRAESAKIIVKIINFLQK